MRRQQQQGRSNVNLSRVNEQIQVLRFCSYYEYYNKSQLTAVSIQELITSQSQSSLTYLQNSMYYIYFIWPSFFHETIYTLFYVNTGVISLVINHESMRSILLRVTFYSLSGLQFMTKIQALYNMKMQGVAAVQLNT